MLENTRNENADQRRAAATLLCGFCANSKAQYTTHVPQLLRGLIHLCTDTDRDVLQMSWEALSAVTKVKYMVSYIQIRQLLHRSILLNIPEIITEKILSEINNDKGL